MKTAIIVVLYETPAGEVQRLRTETEQLGFRDMRLFFVDNTGTGNGYAQGVNQGLRQASAWGADYFMVCNPDISFDGLTAEKIMDPSGHFDVWGFAMRQDDKTYYGGTIDRWRMSGGLNTVMPETRFAPCDFVTGSLMVFSKETLGKAGYFDESYFMYYEDTDFCLRAKRLGLKVGIDAKHAYTHFETSKGSREKEYLLARNRLRFLLKYGSRIQVAREFLRAPLTLFEERGIIASKVFRSPFIRNFLSLNASAFIGKALSFVLFLFLVRYLSVGDYGLYTLVWAHVTILSPLVDFGTTSYGMIYLPREREKRMVSLFSLRFALAAVVFVLTVLLAYLFRYDTQTVFSVFLVSFVIFYNMTSGMYFILTSIKEQMVKTSVISVATNTLMIGVIVAVTFLTRSISAVFMTVAFFYFAYAALYYYLIRKMVPRMKLVFEAGEWKSIIQKSYVFVLISLFAGIYFKIDVFVLNLLKGTGAVGVYSSGYKFYEAMIMIASSYNTLSAPSFSKAVAYRRPSLKSKVAKHALFVGGIGLAVALATSVLGPYLLPVILKGGYRDATAVVQIVIWALPFVLLNSVLLNLLYACELSRIAVFLFVVVSFMNAALNLFLVPRFSYFASSYITVISEAMNLAILSFFVFIRHRRRIFHD